MSQDDSTYLRHMIDGARKAVVFMQGRTRADLDTDEMLMLAVVRLIEIIGEAAKNISQTTRNLYPNIPWRQITGTRDRLVHAYFNVDLDIIWTIVSRELPPLIADLETILNEIGD